MERQSSVPSAVRRLWMGDPLLTGFGLAMLVVLVGALAGLLVDPRTITGAPAWLKPAKFAVSTGLYSFTLAWIFTWLPDWTRTRRVVSRTTAGVFTLEVALIIIQAWRGTTSHFNTTTPMDGAIFGVMGVAILMQTIASCFVARALWVQPFADQAMGAALRAGMIIAVLGASTGGLMTTPTSAQLEKARTTGEMPTSGAHTVGAADGGPGLPGVGWSREHGDLRIPHFVGLHALQVLPLLAVAMRRVAQGARAARLLQMAGVSYGVLFGLLLLQAVRGEPLTSPGPGSLGLFTVWGLGTVGAAVHASRDSSLSDPSTAVGARP